MKIAIIGAGNCGCTIAADLCIRSAHEVTLIKTSTAMHNDNFEYLINNHGQISILENGNIESTHIHHVTNDIACIANMDIIIVYVQTKYHEALIQKIIPYLQKDQIILFNPGYFSTAYMLKYGVRDDVIIVEAESSFIDCRIAEPGLIRVAFRNARNPLGIFPSNRKAEAICRLNQLGFPFTYLSSVVEAALHNPNLIVHTVGAIMSIPRIETMKDQYCMYHEVFTPSVWNILEKLDGEKMDVLEALGFERLPYVEACKFRNSLDNDRDAKEVFFWYAAMPTAVKGPATVNSRYITEDVPQGLVMLEALGQHLNIKTPICSSLINMANAALMTDFRSGGRDVNSLGHDNIAIIMADSKMDDSIPLSSKLLT